MTAYSLREPFTLEDAKALIGKRADITVETDPDEPRTETYRGVLVRVVYQIPGTDRGYIELVGGVRCCAPIGDVRAVDNVRDQD